MGPHPADESAALRKPSSDGSELSRNLVYTARMMRVAALCALLVAVLCPRALAAPGGPPVVAVMYFDYQGKDEELLPLKKGLANMLISDLTDSEAYRVVERERLEDVLSELKLQASARIDQASAVKAGKLLGAQYLVLGSYFDVLKRLRVDARIVEVETGKIVQSVGSSGQPDDFLALEQKLATDLGRHLGELALVRARTGAKPAKPRARSAGQGNDAGGLTAPSLALADAGLPKRAAGPRPPKRLSLQTAAEYGRALSALDAKDVEAAKGHLKKVVSATSDFELASLDLKRLMKQ